MTPSKKHIIYEAAAAPKGKEKSIEAPEHADRQPDPSDVHISNADHISNAEESHSNSASPRGRHAVEPEPQVNSEQLLQMLSTLRNMMGDSKR